MFNSRSRYYSLETTSHTRADGREIVYVKRRFLPQGSSLRLLTEVNPIDGDRLDLIAARTIGDAEQFWRICDANDAMNPFDMIEPGETLRVAIPGADQ